MPEMTEESHDKPLSVQSVSRPGLETSTSGIETEALSFDLIYAV
jgi:hypothetical protein